MKNETNDGVKKFDGGQSGVSPVSRRALLKMGAGAGVMGVAGMMDVRGQDAGKAEPFVPMSRWKGVTGRVAKAGYKNDSGRAYGNGPMDETTRRIVSYVHSFSETNLTDEVVKDLGVMLVDTIGCAIAGFESDAIRIGTKVAQMYPAGALKSTVWGYGVTTTPDMAGFVGGCMVRHNDYNDNGAHASDVVPGILAVGEALHATGAQILTAMVIMWEVLGALQLGMHNYDAHGIDNLYIGPAAAMAVGKLLGLNEDQLANALSLSLVPHIPLRVDHANGPNSMSKGNHDAEMVRCAIFAAVCAQQGMTGPAQPFEGMDGLWDTITGPFDLKIPAHVGNNPMRPLPTGDERFVCQTLEYKRFPGNGGAPVLSLVPEFRSFAKLEDIASIDIEVNQFGDGSDAGKFDPRNEETADHSTPFYIAWALVHGELFLDAYTKEALRDPMVRELMGKMTIRENASQHGTKLTVRTKAGAELTRVAAEGAQVAGSERPVPMTQAELDRKFDRICAYKGISNAQRDQIRANWADLRGVKDVGVPVRATLAHFGRFLPL